MNGQRVFSGPSLATIQQARAEVETTTTEPSFMPDIELWKAAEAMAEELKKRMSPAGALGLPKMLEARRLQYGIPDEAFVEHAVYDRLLVWQIEPRFLEELSKKPDQGLIIRTDRYKKLEKMEAPRGVIVTAGLLALDALRSNGMDLGHIVNFGRLAVYRKVICEIMGREQHLLILAAGDVISSEDLHDNLKNRVCRVKFNEAQGIHEYIDENGKTWRPMMPAIDPAS